jgi:cytochrome P450 family 6
MKIMFEIIENLGEKLVEVVEIESIISSGVIEISDFLARFTTDTISSVAFGIEGYSLEDPQSIVRKHGKDILDFKPLDFLKFFFVSCYPNLARKLHMTCNKTSIIDFFHTTFIANMEHREKNNIKRNDFLQLLIELKKTSSLTSSEIAAESFLFFVAGEKFHVILKINC